MLSKEKILLALRDFKRHLLNQNNSPMLMRLLVLKISDIDWVANTTIGMCKHLAEIGLVEILHENYIRITEKGLESIRHL